MALWWAHLRVAERTHARMADVDLAELRWGALCPDVDKVSSVTRELSHYSDEALDPERFSDTVGLEPAAAWRMAFCSTLLLPKPPTMTM